MQTIHDVRCRFQRAWAWWRHEWYIKTGIVNFLVAWINLITVIVRAKERMGALPDFWTQVRLPGYTAIMFTFFFAAASVVSLVAHGLLSYEQKVRKVAWLSIMMAVYVTIYLVLAAMRLTSPMLPINMAIHEMAILAMFYCICACCGESGPRWLIAQLVLHCIVLAILAGQGDKVFLAGGDIIAAIENKGGWRQAIFLVYFILGGLLRIGALRDGQVAQARHPSEAWWYRFIIVMHLGAWFAFLSRPTMLKTYGVDSAFLLHTMCILIVYSFTPLLLCHFVALTHARAVEMAVLVDKANRKADVAHIAAESRRQFLRYVFHEVRVPFNSIVLGLDELRAYPEVATQKAIMTDIQLMQAAAATMQAVLNDTLDAEKMHSGSYKLEIKPLSLQQTLFAVVNNMKPWARQDHVTLTVRVDDNVPRFVKADPHRLAQVVANFVSNGIKFVPRDGTGRVDVRAFRIPAPSMPPLLEHESEGSASTGSSAGSNVAPSFRTGQTGYGAVVGNAIDAIFTAPFDCLGRLSQCRIRRRRQNDDIRTQQDSADDVIVTVDSTTGAAHDDVSVGLPDPLVNMGNKSKPKRRAHRGVTARTAVTSGLKDSLAKRQRSKRPESEVKDPVNSSTSEPTANEEATLSEAASTGIVPTAANNDPTDSPAEVWIRIEVSDNGVGINEEDQRRLFKAFVQIDAGVHQKGKGTGLGLHICKEIVQRHGGYVGVVSKIGSGSTFFAEIPFRFASNDEAGSLQEPSTGRFDLSSGTGDNTGTGSGSTNDASSNSQPHASSAGSVRTGCNEAEATPAAEGTGDSNVNLSPTATAPGAADSSSESSSHRKPIDSLKLMVVDDVATNRSFLVRAIRRNLPRAEVLEACDGAEAVDMVAKDITRFHVICMDKEMPIMDGFEATQKLREMGFKGLIIGVTANALSDDVSAFMAKGLDAVVTKPVSVRELLDVVEEHL